ncbi:MAG: hypothetical protein JWO67_6235 [Streptosporangiaceae bacterium]|nr:hypothetical protein [Streptosporangiaceae bacterium]
MPTQLQDTTADDTDIMLAAGKLADVSSHEAFVLREQFRMTIADHRRDGGCWNAGGCPTAHTARLLLAGPQAPAAAA